MEGEKRITCLELAQWLAKYDDEIVELREFTVQELPNKLQNLITRVATADSRTRQTVVTQHQQQVPT